MIKIPKYIERELQKASDYALKSKQSIEKFESWVKNNIDEEFDFDTLRAMSNSIEMRFQTEALTEIEYGNDVDIDAIQHTIDQYISNKCV